MMMWRALQPKQILDALQGGRPSPEARRGGMPAAANAAPTANSGSEAGDKSSTCDAAPKDEH